jgi:hypothetical protein
MQVLTTVASNYDHPMMIRVFSKASCLLRIAFFASVEDNIVTFLIIHRNAFNLFQGNIVRPRALSY